MRLRSTRPETVQKRVQSTEYRRGNNRYSNRQDDSADIQQTERRSESNPGSGTEGISGTGPGDIDLSTVESWKVGSVYQYE